MICHLSITKPNVAQGVSAVVDTIAKHFCDKHHCVLRIYDDLPVKGAGDVPIVRNSHGSISRLNRVLRSVGPIYLAKMLFDGLRLAIRFRRAPPRCSLVVCHDVFSLLWVSSLFSGYLTKNAVQLALYNHSNGHPLDTVAEQYKSVFVNAACRVMKTLLGKVKLFAVYSLSDSAGELISHSFHYRSDIRFVTVFNYIHDAELAIARVHDESEIWMIGTVCPRKRQLDLFSQIAGLRLNLKDLKIKVLGFADAAQIERLNEYEFVEYMGVVDDVRQHISTHDICVSVSSNEGLPVSQIEAISVGAVLISTDVGGCSQVCVEGYNGFLLPERYRVEDLITIIQRLRSDTKLLHRYSTNSIKLFKDRFSIRSANRFWLVELDRARAF